MTIEKQSRVLELKSEISSAFMMARMKSQSLGMLTHTGSLTDFFKAQSEERKAANKVEDLVDELAKEALNEDNK